MLKPKRQYHNAKIALLACFALSLLGCKGQSGKFIIEDLGKEYILNRGRLEQGLYHHIEDDDDVIGGNTSIRNIDAAHLEWKGDPKGNGYGYYQRNRDLGQVFKVDSDHNRILDALVLRTSRGNNAVMAGAAGSELNIIFFEVVRKRGEEIGINENGTSKGDKAKHGFDLGLNRADDFIEGATYNFLYHFKGGVFPSIPPTSQYVYDSGRGEEFGEQAGHLRYFRCLFSRDSELVLERGKTYAFMIGFVKPGEARGLALAITSEVHSKSVAKFVKDTNGNSIWGIRREGDGTLPPTMIEAKSPPLGTERLKQLIKESVFPRNHFRKLSPTSDGYPDVDTYRTLQFYLESRSLTD